MVLPACDVAEAFSTLQTLQASLTGARPIPQEYLTREKLEPMLPGLGISRVGSLAGLDEIEIPVWFAVRPQSRALCVSGGKGVTEDAAWISAVMESAEQALAEDAPALVKVVASPAEIARRGLRSVPLQRQSRCAANHLCHDRELAWVKGLSLKTGEPILAPYELVGMDMSTSAPWNKDHFRMSSIGLAAAGDMASAILHGLRELVEEDATFAPMAGGPPGDRREVVFNRHVADGLSWSIDRLAERAIEARFCETRDDVDMPVIMAALKSGRREDAHLTYFCGSACRSTVEAAALAALLEAVQTRMVFVSGARDDLFAEEYGQRLKPGTEALFGGYQFINEPTGECVDRIDQTPLRTLVSTIFRSGIPDAYVFPLGGRRHGMEVVRVLADDLVSFEGVGRHPRTGRAGEKLLRQWSRP